MVTRGRVTSLLANKTGMTAVFVICIPSQMTVNPDPESLPVIPLALLSFKPLVVIDVPSAPRYPRPLSDLVSGLAWFLTIPIMHNRIQSSRQVVLHLLWVRRECANLTMLVSSSVNTRPFFTSLWS